MALKTTVKVGNITNLSDARYCAGMGVNMLGFNVSPGTPNYMKPQLFQEIRGWITGPKVVAEVMGNDVPLDEIVNAYAPDFLEISFHSYQNLSEQIQIPIIVRLSPKDIDESIVNDQRIAYLCLENFPEQQYTKPLLVKINSSDSVGDLKLSESIGIALVGSSEVRPGFKEYEIADILEKLEVD